ncbi:hypothetical protein AB835_04685 [Candidatus Endobugula sertula]|uniref:Holin of 3TMs, for gene-transfer release n=1 Tax=Candidatus Endobugula sertula TaxID=62101 RepID=A0A1D2QRG4_9GAMM|nr:hypothetical protein AB835_04685 [Candidatus Endobugula sertula]
MWKLFSGVLNTLVGEPIKQWQRRKTLKAEQQYELAKLDGKARIAKATALAEMAKQGQQNDFDLDMMATKNMEKSWKDELILCIFLLPIVLAFIPDMQPHVLNGFAAIEKMPHWYVAIVIGMVVVIYGMRGLLKAYLTRGKLPLSFPSKTVPKKPQAQDTQVTTQTQTTSQTGVRKRTS